jgi:hypothetical protein
MYNCKLWYLKTTIFQNCISKHALILSELQWEVVEHIFQFSTTSCWIYVTFWKIKKTGASSCLRWSQNLVLFVLAHLELYNLLRVL